MSVRDDGLEPRRLSEARLRDESYPGRTLTLGEFRATPPDELVRVMRAAVVDGSSGERDEVLSGFGPGALTCLVAPETAHDQLTFGDCQRVGDVLGRFVREASSYRVRPDGRSFFSGECLSAAARAYDGLKLAAYGRPGFDAFEDAFQESRREGLSPREVTAFESRLEDAYVAERVPGGSRDLDAARGAADRAIRELTGGPMTSAGVQNLEGEVAFVDPARWWADARRREELMAEWLPVADDENFTATSWAGRDIAYARDWTNAVADVLAAGAVSSFSPWRGDRFDATRDAIRGSLSGTDEARDDFASTVVAMRSRLGVIRAEGDAALTPGVEPYVTVVSTTELGEESRWPFFTEAAAAMYARETLTPETRLTERRPRWVGPPEHARAMRELSRAQRGLEPAPASRARDSAAVRAAEAAARDVSLAVDGPEAEVG